MITLNAGLAGVPSSALAARMRPRRSTFALMQSQGRVALEEIPELREALQYANHGGKLSRQSILGLDWVKETARKSQVAVIGAGVQGSISTLPPGPMEALCAAASESGDRVAGIVKKHTVMAKRALPRFTPSSVSGPTVDQRLSDPVAASEAAADAAPAVPTDSSDTYSSAPMAARCALSWRSAVLQILSSWLPTSVLAPIPFLSCPGPSPSPRPSSSPGHLHKLVSRLFSRGISPHCLLPRRGGGHCATKQMHLCLARCRLRASRPVAPMQRPSVARLGRHVPRLSLTPPPTKRLPLQLALP